MDAGRIARGEAALRTARVVRQRRRRGRRSARAGAGAALTKVPDPTLYLFDGYNLLHAGDYPSVERLVDELASFVALEGARGIVVFDGVGQDTERGPLEVRYAPHADTLLERLAAEHRDREEVCLVSSDAAVRGTSGQQVRKLSSRTFLRERVEAGHAERAPLPLADRLDEATRARLERPRRGQQT